MTKLAGRLSAVASVVVRVPSLVLLGAIKFYQLAISPYLAPRCRYYPSCSQYGLVAVQRFGVLKGIGLATWRVLRCNPFSAGGIDDVPLARDAKNARGTQSKLLGGVNDLARVKDGAAELALASIAERESV